MKPMNKPDPKLVKLGEDLPWLCGVDGGRGDLTVNETKVTKVAFVTRKEYNWSRGPEVQRSRGPEVQRSRGPEVQRSQHTGVVCHEVRPTGGWRASSCLHAFNRLPVQS